MRMPRPDPLFPLTRRSSFLMLFGAAYCAIGWSYIAGPSTPALRRSLDLALTVVPVAAWGALWVVCGVLAIVTGVLRWVKPLGFAALTFVGTLWGAAYFVGWIAGDAPRGWVSALIFWMVSAAVHIVAGMSESSGRR